MLGRLQIRLRLLLPLLGLFGLLPQLPFPLLRLHALQPCSLVGVALGQLGCVLPDLLVSLPLRPGLVICPALGQFSLICLVLLATDQGLLEHGQR
ncbi:hypothetical protein D3C81_2033630 [compost metagenome]